MLGVFLDSETNGLNPQLHNMIEIAFQIVDMGSGSIKEKYETTLSLDRHLWDKSDPESLKINGFCWEEVALGKPPSLVREEIIAIFTRNGIKRKKAVFICQNPSFDRVFFSKLISPEVQEKLGWPYHWLDLASMHWALSINRAAQGKGPFPWETGVSKDAIASFYKIASEEKPHRAMNGVDHLLLCYKAVVGFPT